ncbi:MAG: LodA/GoxA family CTQ-dependent oxidase [Magnetovibrio sp.]|nr:LodA/GoxA family CTQ-dependent oxidase [Magnetovibrio sp.]
MVNSFFRVHPAINIGRVGNSKDYYIAPETAAGKLQDPSTGLFGGLPTQHGTEDTPIDSSDFRDAEEKVVRQAARYRIYAYDTGQDTYPSTDPGREVKIGDKIGDKEIVDIVWTVHLANKKNNAYTIESANGIDEGVVAYEDGHVPPIRNPEYGDELSNEERLKQLVIDAGPRAIKSSKGAASPVEFNATTACCHAEQSGKISEIPDYPVSFPSDYFEMYNYDGPIETLGQLQIESDTGRLIVTGGYGKVSGIKVNGKEPPLKDAVDNDGWFDDTSDGPVNAVIVFDDQTTSSVVGGWFSETDPGYAPQTRNVVSVWDDTFNTWVEELDLVPDLYSDGKYNPSYQVSFLGEVLPVFYAALLQRWNTNFASKAINGHNHMAQITFKDNPKVQIPNFKSLIRDPNVSEENDVGVKMPLALGDAMKRFLAVSKTQYFMLMQWFDGKCIEDEPAMGGGETLDRVVMENLLGGRYSPGIDLGFIVRDVHLFKVNWKGETGPFRINEEPLDYSKVRKGKPFLGVGYLPLRTAMVQPGDLGKFLSQPWHTDYNSCAIHQTDPNPNNDNTLYWSWPAQRPVQVFPASLCAYDVDKKVWNLGGQLYSIRGDNLGSDNLTHTDYPQKEGRYQEYTDYTANWHKVGFVIQGSQIKTEDGGNYGSKYFLEVASQFNPTPNGDPTGFWPTAAIPKSKD